MKRFQWVVTFVEFIRFNLSSLTRIIFLTITSVVIEKLAIDLATVQRGYVAFGGEYFLFPMIMVCGYLFLFVLPNKWELFD